MAVNLSRSKGAGLTVQYCSDKGMVRSNNEDYCGYFIPDDAKIRGRLGSLIVVSDGVGSSSAGEVASAEAVNVLLQEYYFGEHTERIPDRLQSVFGVTALHLYDLSTAGGSCFKMMCTLTALLIKENRFFITHVGDSKAYLLRGGQFIQLTKDHSVVGKLERMGFITKEQARTHPNKHVILRALGDNPILPPDLYSGNVMPGDLFFLCTDGIFEHYTDEELKEFLMSSQHRTDGAAKLVATANERGGQDNMTVMIVDTD